MISEKNFKYSELFSSNLNNSNYIVFVTSLKKELYDLSNIYKKYDFLNYDYYCYYDTLINTNIFIIKEKHKYLKKIKGISSQEYINQRNKLIIIISETIKYFELKYELFSKKFLNSKKRKLISI